MWAALASAGDHLLAVNASPARLGRRRGNGGRGIKERVLLVPPRRRRLRRGRELGASSLPAALRQVRRAEGAGDHRGGRGRSPLPLGLCKGTRAASTRGGGGNLEVGQRADLPRGRELRPSRLPGAARARSGGGKWGAVGAALRLFRELARSASPCGRNAVQSALQSLGSRNGVSITGRTSWAPAYQPSPR